MPDERNHLQQSLPVANYSSAIARAVEWLGDRYLLATPQIMRPKSNESAGPMHAMISRSNRAI